MKRLLIALGSLLSIVSGYSLHYFSLDVGAAVRRELSTICPQDWTAKDFHLVGTQTQSQKTIAVYRINCFDGDSNISQARKSFLGYEVLEHRGLRWRSPQPGSHLEVLPEFSQEYIEYGTVNRENQQSRPALIYGEILSPDVAAIEVTFDTGESLRQENKDRVFAIASLEATEVREIKVIGENGQTLQQDSNRLPTVDNNFTYVPVAPSPEEIVRHSYFSGDLCPNRAIRQKVQVLGDFRILRAVQYPPYQQVVFFRLLCRTDGRAIQSALIGMETVEQRNASWQQVEAPYFDYPINYDFKSLVRQGNVWRGFIYSPLLNFSAPFLSEGETLRSTSLMTSNKAQDGNSTFYFGSTFECSNPLRDSLTPAATTADESYTFYAGSTFEYRDLFAPAEAVAVEVTFGTGETLRDQVVNGIFNVMLPKNTGVCQVKFLGSDGRVLAEQS